MDSKPWLIEPARTTEGDSMFRDPLAAVLTLGKETQ
jgi:hypothetical protein